MAKRLPMSDDRELMRKRDVNVAVLFLVACLSGCGQAVGPDTVAVTGQITFEGAAVSGALVVFAPTNETDESRQAAQAETSEDGTFEIQTFVKESNSYKPGIVPGEYKVIVTKLEIPKDMRGQPKHLLPKRYRQMSTTPLAAIVVQDDEQVFDFVLEKR